VVDEAPAAPHAHDGREATRTPAPIQLRGGATPAAVAGWVQEVAQGADLVVIEAAPLTESIDGALLACGCDGLVIVTEAERTTREALQLAVERSRLGGCRTLGVVVRGGPNRLPPWLSRMLSTARIPVAAETR
jgi:hypothetical protein